MAIFFANQDFKGIGENDVMAEGIALPLPSGNAIWSIENRMRGVQSKGLGRPGLLVDKATLDGSSKADIKRGLGHKVATGVDKQRTASIDIGFHCRNMTTDKRFEWRVGLTSFKKDHLEVFRKNVPGARLRVSNFFPVPSS